MKYIYTLLIISFLSFSALQADYWEEVTDITPSSFIDSYWLDIYFLPSNLNYGWVCGRDARVLRTTDRGKTWRGVTLPSTEHLESIHFTTQNIGYVSGVDGIWKSEDGGINWTDITPSDTVSYWGCYFWDSNTGVVVGDGCSLYHQYFWHTTDGGNSWTQFEGNQENSGLTDALIVNPNTEAYAISSGRLWISYDGGRNWEVKDTTGTTVWHEEITKFSNSFLIPTSGTTCSGGGSVGGMRFSTNGGATWTDRSAPRGPMYGTFLINQAKGWACGLYGQVLYTDDAGQSWKEMSCGLDNSHLDDIRFLSETEGWVVGQGLYRLGKNTYEVSEDPVIFPDMCLPGYKDHTIYISNKSFESNIVSLNIIGLDKDDFTLMMPKTTINMASCDDIPVVIRFEPNTLGEKNAILHCEFTGVVTRDIPLNGFALEPSLIMDSTTIVINPAYCGLMNSRYIELGSLTKKDTIDSYNKKNGSNDIKILSSMPLGVTVGSTFAVEATPKDTGWVEAQYLLHLKPCENDTVITVRAYGVSPIINAPLQIQQVLACTNKGEILIPISNTGNTELYLPNLDFIEDNANFKFKGTKSKKSFPLSIAQGSSDTLIVELLPQDFGIHEETLYIYNNDSTKVRGNKNPFIIELRYEYSTPLPEISTEKIDFGRICLGESQLQSFKFFNKGSIELTLTNILAELNLFGIDSEKYSNRTIHPLDSLEIDINFLATEIGKKYDTLKIVTNPCEDTLFVVLTSQVETAAIRATPEDVLLNLQTGESEEASLNLKSYSTIDLNITNISLVPENPDLLVQFADTFPLELKSGKSLDLLYSIIASKDLSYSGSLCIETDGFCDADTCIPFTIESFSGKIELSANDINFGYFTCEPQTITKSITITNSSDYADTLTKITINPTGDFAITNLPSLPLLMKSGDELTLDISYVIQNEGKFSAELLISSYLMQGRDIKVPLDIEFRTPKISVSALSADFGTKERCDIATSFSFSIANSGTLADTLEYSDNSIAGFSNTLNDNLIILPNTDTTITITFDPTQTQGLGNKSYKITLRSEVCDFEFTHTSSADIIAPRVSFLPTTVNLGQVWKDFSKDTVIVIFNNSQVERTISHIEFMPEVPGLEFDFDLPKAIPVGLTDTIYINFKATEKGNFSTKLFIEDRSVCIDSTYLDFVVSVPDEYYKVDLRTNNYIFDIHEKGTLEVFLDNPVFKFNPENITLDLNYDINLFNPEKAYLHNKGVKTEIEFQPISNGVSITSNSVSIDSLFTEAGLILSVEGKPLASFPQSSGLLISEVHFGTNKPFDLETKNGSIQVEGYCEAVINDGLMMLPNMQARLINSINSDNIVLELESDLPQLADISIIDLSGSETKAKIFVDKKAEYQISTATFSQGVYFIVLKTEWGKRVVTSKFLILK